MSAPGCARPRVAFRGGTRVREISRILHADGAAIAALPSHDAQSIAGILSTEVHGTGRDWGFFSQWVESIKLIDAKGEVHSAARPVVRPADAGSIRTFFCDTST